MTARQTVQSLSGAVLSICVTRPTTFDAAGYIALTPWVVIGEVENYGTHGVNGQIIEFTNVANAAVQKLKGSKNYGTMTMTLGNVPADVGQVILAAAAESNNRYSIRIVYPLGNGEVTPEGHYLDALVASREIQDGSVNDVRKIAVALAICQKQVEVAAT